MNTSKVLGVNLRKLCESRKSISAVAAELEISRIQFTRYLNGESFPKPAVFKRIVEYFNVGADIYIDLLTEEQLAASYAGQQADKPLSQAYTAMQGYEYALTGRACFGALPRLPNECVIMWRRSYSQPEKYFSMLVKFGVCNGCKIVRGYEPAVQSPQLFVGFDRLADLPLVNTREIRGIVMESGEGFLITYFPPRPRVTIGSSYIHLDPEWADLGLLPGVSMLNRLGKDGLELFSNTVLEFIPQKLSEIVRRGRGCGFHSENEVPDKIIDYLKAM